jgi:hypothetical protein
MQLLNFHIIYTFAEKEQKMLYLEQIRNDTIQEQFMKLLLYSLELDELRSLLKISCCQLYQDEHSELLSYLADREGKYYFNVDINDDSDTKYWYDFKTNYIRINED